MYEDTSFLFVCCALIVAVYFAIVRETSVSWKLAEEYINQVAPVYIRDCVTAFGNGYNVIVVCKPKAPGDGFAYYVTTKRHFSVAAKVAKELATKKRKSHPEEDFFVVIIQNAKIVGAF